MRTLAEYRAAVLGAPLYIGHWLKDAQRFLTLHHQALTERPPEGIRVAIFTLGPTRADEQEWQGVCAQLDQELAKFPWLTPVAAELFGGRFDPAKLRFPPDASPLMTQSEQVVRIGGILLFTSLRNMRRRKRERLKPPLEGATALVVRHAARDVDHQRHVHGLFGLLPHCQCSLNHVGGWNLQNRLRLRWVNAMLRVERSSERHRRIGRTEAQLERLELLRFVAQEHLKNLRRRSGFVVDPRRVQNRIRMIAPERAFLRVDRDDGQL